MLSRPTDSEGLTSRGLFKTWKWKSYNAPKRRYFISTRRHTKDLHRNSYENLKSQLLCCTTVLFQR